MDNIITSPPTRSPIIGRLLIGLVIIVVIGTGTYFVITHKKATPTSQAQAVAIPSTTTTLPSTLTTATSPVTTTTTPVSTSTTAPTVTSTTTAKTTPTITPTPTPTVAGKTIDISDSNDNGKTITLTMADKLQIDAHAAGDGGYSANDPQFDSGVLSQQNHNYTSPSQDVPTGQSGVDTWIFQPVAVGQTTVTISEKRPWETSSTTLATFQIIVTK